MFNEPPEEGFEYLLARIRFWYMKSPAHDTQYDLSSDQFTAVSGEGKDYDICTVVAPEPRIDWALFPTGIREGWVHSKLPKTMPTL
ncbi:MAG: hypothetical protein ACE5OY_04750 [Candidatus Bathyarchaeia archaeon]